MVTSSEVHEFIGSDSYHSLLARVKDICNFEVNDEAPPDIVFEHDASKINKANLTINELRWIVENDENKFINFVKLKFDEVFPDSHEQEGNDDKDILIKIMPFYKNFLMIYLLEFYLLKNKPSELDSYLKLIRIPHSKKYSSQLKKIYSSL